MSELVRTYASDPCDEPVAWKTNVIPREEEDDLKHFFKIADMVVIRIAKKYETITFNEFQDEWIEFEKYYFRQLDLIYLRSLVCIDSHELKDKQTRVNYAFQRYTNCPKRTFEFKLKKTLPETIEEIPENITKNRDVHIEQIEKARNTRGRVFL